MTLLNYLKSNCPVDIIEKKLEEETNFDGCLEEAIRYIPKETRILEFIIKKTKNFDKALELAVGMENEGHITHREIIHVLLKLANNHEGVLYQILYHKIGDLDLIYEVFEKTNNFNGCLFWAIKNYDFYKSEKLILDLLPKTNIFANCAEILFLSSITDKQIINEILSKQKFTDLCFKNAIHRYDIHKDYLYENLKKVTNFYGCLEDAINFSGDKEFIELIFSKTKNFEGALLPAIVKYYDTDRELVYRIYEKSKYFDNLNEAINLGTLDKDFLIKLCEKATYFNGCLLAVLDKYIDDRDLFDLVHKNVYNIDNSCLNLVIKNGITDTYIIDKVFEKTSSFKGCLLELSKSNYHNIDLAEKIFKITKEKVSVERGNWLPSKMCNFFVANEDCFICLLPLNDPEEEPQEIHALECRHSIHKNCNIQNFRCPMH